MPQGNSASTPEGTGPDRQTGTLAAFLERALDAYRAGEHAAAERILRQLVEQRPQSGDAWHLRGLNAAAAGHLRNATRYFVNAVGCDTANAQFCAALARHLSRVGQDQAAVEPWRRTLDLAPDNGNYPAEYAYCLARLGRYREALPAFEAAIGRRPDDAPLLAAFGTALMNMEDYVGAVARLGEARRMSPEDASIVMRLGYALQQAGREVEAVPIYREALAVDPTLDEVRLNLSVCLRTLGDIDGAIAACRSILRRDPAAVGALNNLGIALCDAGRHDEAIAAFERALRREPRNLTALHNLGVALDATGAASEAENCFGKCLELRPNWSDARRSLANLLRGRGRFEEAAAHYRAVIDAQPLDFASYGNLGLVLLNLNRAEEAASVYEKAIALRPDRPELRLGLGIAQLTVGDFAGGWDNYEARLALKKPDAWRPGHGLRRWRGEPLREDGRRPTVIVHAEQGFGDSIHFCRYLPLAAARGATIVFECQSALSSLMASLAPRLGVRPFPVITPADPLPPADFHIPLLSLPGLFTVDAASIPAQVPYLAPPPDKTATWAERHLGGPPAVGLVWAGNPARQDDRLRSCPPDALAPILAVAGVDFYSLQKDAPEDVPQPSGLTALGPLLEDFGDTAAAIARLDLVITVDTAVAHLAGAIGKPVWVMLGRSADWRYMLNREDSPWYPTMRLFRQTDTDGWQAVADRIARALRDTIAAQH